MERRHQLFAEHFHRLGDADEREHAYVPEVLAEFCQHLIKNVVDVAACNPYWDVFDSGPCTIPIRHIHRLLAKFGYTVIVGSEASYVTGVCLKEATDVPVRLAPAPRFDVCVAAPFSAEPRNALTTL